MNKIHQIRVGIIRYGFMEHSLEAELKSTAGVTVAAIADRNSFRSAEIPEGVAYCGSAQELAEHPDVDVILIAADGSCSLELVKIAAQAGKDIIFENPAVMSVSEFDEMMRLVRVNNVKFTVHWQHRFDPDFRTVREIIDSSTLGEVFAVKSCLYGLRDGLPDRRPGAEGDGGILIHWGAYLLDQMLYLIPGRVTCVYALMRNVCQAETDDFCNIQLRFESGLSAELEFGTCFLKDEDHWFDRHWFIGGSCGSAYADGSAPQGKIVRAASPSHKGGEREDSLPQQQESAGCIFGTPPPGRIITESLPEIYPQYSDFFENYVRACYGEEAFLVRPTEVRRVLLLMDAVRESARTGRSVSIEE